MDIHGRAVLITGGRRIGAVVAADLASRGADIAVVYQHSQNAAEAAADAARQSGRRAVALQADLSAPDSCQRIVDETVRAFGRLDILINVASIYSAKPFDDVTLEDWDRQFAVDLRAAWLCSRAAVPHMRRLGSGRIINFSDWVARSGRPRYVGYLPYYVAKAGVIALTEALALEVAADGILVNAVAPGPIVPPGDISEEEVARVERATPLGRWGGAVEIAKTVRVLIESDFITGETIRVDGGRHLK